MNSYRVLPLPPKDQEWMLPEVSGDTHFISDEEHTLRMSCMPGRSCIQKGPDTLIAFNVGKRIYIEVFQTVKCPCGSLFVTEGEMERHL